MSAGLLDTIRRTRLRPEREHRSASRLCCRRRRRMRGRECSSSDRRNGAHFKAILFGHEQTDARAITTKRPYSAWKAGAQVRPLRGRTHSPQFAFARCLAAAIVQFSQNPHRVETSMREPQKRAILVISCLLEARAESPPLFHKSSSLKSSYSLVAPQGFEPRLIGSEPTVLPLNEGATDCLGVAIYSLTTSFSVRSSRS